MALLFMRVDLFSVGDAATVACDSTGIYSRNDVGRVSSVARGVELCGILWNAENVALSPDGRAVLVSTRHDVDGVTLWNLQADSGETFATQCPARSFSWSPTGFEVAVVEECPAPKAGYVLQVVGIADRTFARTLLHGAVGEAAWSSDGRWIAVAHRASDAVERIVVIERATGTVKELAVHGRDPSWSPRDDRLAYISPGSNILGLTKLQFAADGRFIGASNAVQLQTFAGPRELGGPILWSPKGDRIAVSHGERLWIVGLVGSRSNATLIR